MLFIQAKINIINQNIEKPMRKQKETQENKMKRVTLLLILSHLTPYGIAQEVPMYESITYNVPKIGVTTEVYLGDQMLEQRTGDYRECIIPKN